MAVASNSERLERLVSDVVFTFLSGNLGGRGGPCDIRVGCPVAGHPHVGTLSQAASRRQSVLVSTNSVSENTCQRLLPFPPDVRRALVQPRQLRRHDPTSVQVLEHIYELLIGSLKVACSGLGADLGPRG